MAIKEQKVFSTGTLFAQPDGIEFALMQDVTVSCEFQEKKLYGPAWVNRFPSDVGFFGGEAKIKAKVASINADALAKLTGATQGTSVGNGASATLAAGVLTGVNPATFTLSKAIPVGHRIIVVMHGTGARTSSGGSITDSQGNTYAADIIQENTGVDCVAIWSGLVATALAIGDTLTFGMPGSGNIAYTVLDAVNVAATFGDGTHGTTRAAVTSTACSETLVTTGAGDLLIFGATGTDATGGFTAPTAGWSSDLTQNGYAALWNTQLAAGSISASVTSDAVSQDVVTAIAAYKASTVPYPVLTDTIAKLTTLPFFQAVFTTQDNAGNQIVTTFGNVVGKGLVIPLQLNDFAMPDFEVCGYPDANGVLYTEVHN